MKQTAAHRVVLLMACLWMQPLHADPTTDPAAVLPGTDFVFYGADRPHVFRFLTTIAGRPVAEYEEQVLSDLFTMLDVDQNGMLSSQERKLLPSQRTLTVLGISGSPRSSSRQLLQQGPRSSVKTKEDLRSYLHWLGLDSLSLNNPTPANSRTSPVAASAGQLLFQALDLDCNKRLTQTELKAAAYNMRKCDLNGDEIWTVQELIVVSTPGPANHSRETAPVAFVPVGFLRPQQFGLECLRRYRAVSHDSSAANDDMPVEPLSADIAPLDGNGDGKLTADEWAKLLDPVVPDRIFVMQMQAGSAQPGSSQLNVLDQQGQSTKQARGNQADLKFLPFRLLLRVEEHNTVPDESKLKAIFAQNDRDKNDYLDRSEASGLLGVDFFDVDTDQNGKVYWEEYEAGIRPLFLMMTLKTRIDLDESGFDLFAAVNTISEDGLTLRELKNLPEIMQQWDSDHDGEIINEELPKNFNLVLTRGLGMDQLSRDRRQATIDTPRMVSSRRQSPPSSNPAWFSNMDRNQDGDLSPREFLGDARTFERFDVNHDGLIDRQEAIAAQ